MYRYLIFCIALFNLIGPKANAQATLQGRVFELSTHIKLQSIRVTNLTSKQYTTTDSAGIFYIYAKPGDLLAFRGYAYKPDTVAIVNKNHLEIYLSPEGKTLNEVNVSNIATKTGSLRDPSLKGDAVTYQRDANNAYKGGLAIRFGYGRDKKAIHNRQLTDEELADDQIDQIFNPQKLSKYIPLTGQPMLDFIVMYRPDTKTFKAPNFDLTLYINQCYKKYMALPVDKRKPVNLLQDTAKKG